MAMVRMNGNSDYVYSDLESPEWGTFVESIAWVTGTRVLLPEIRATWSCCRYVDPKVSCQGPILRGDIGGRLNRDILLAV
jgi:hypothetical protein